MSKERPTTGTDGLLTARSMLLSRSPMSAASTFLRPLSRWIESGRKIVSIWTRATLHA